VEEARGVGGEAFEKKRFRKELSVTASNLDQCMRNRRRARLRAVRPRASLENVISDFSPDHDSLKRIFLVVFQRAKGWYSSVGIIRLDPHLNTSGAKAEIRKENRSSGRTLEAVLFYGSARIIET
jgi:hypothetical protein